MIPSVPHPEAASVDDILTWLLRLEDRTLAGHVTNLGDGAGLTRFGITQKWNARYLPDSFWNANMSTPVALQFAKDFYQHEYWDRYNMGEMSMPLAASVLSCAVNCGISTANKLYAQAEGSVWVFIHNWINHYLELVEVHPESHKFLTGWTNRANAVFPDLPK